MPDDVPALIEALDGPMGDCCDAEGDLVALGPAVVPPLLAALPGLSETALLHVVDVFTALRDPRTHDPLIALLGHEDPTVRQWAAYALGELGVAAAVPALRRAWRASKDAGTPLDHGEPDALRATLTVLGDRVPVVPPGVRALAQAPDLDHGALVLVADLRAAVDELAAHGQAVLGIRFEDAERRAAWSRPYADLPEPDLAAPWPDVVAAAHAAAVAAAADPPKATYAWVTWVGEDDR